MGLRMGLRKDPNDLPSRIEYSIYLIARPCHSRGETLKCRCVRLLVGRNVRLNDGRLAQG